MNDMELLARLKAHEPFGISMVQRIALFGYQRAVETLERFEAQGVIERDEVTSLWRLVGRGSTVQCQQRPGVGSAQPLLNSLQHRFDVPGFDADGDGLTGIKH